MVRVHGFNGNVDVISWGEVQFCFEFDLNPSSFPLESIRDVVSRELYNKHAFGYEFGRGQTVRATFISVKFCRRIKKQS